MAPRKRVELLFLDRQSNVFTVTLTRLLLEHRTGFEPVIGQFCRLLLLTPQPPVPVFLSLLLSNCLFNLSTVPFSSWCLLKILFQLSSKVFSSTLRGLGIDPLPQSSNIDNPFKLGWSLCLDLNQNHYAPNVVRCQVTPQRVANKKAPGSF